MDGELTELELTYGELDRQARAIAALLQTSAAAGERALILYPPGLDYIAAFFGCLYAGVIAVPAYPPQLNRQLPRIQAIAADAGARLALTTTPILSSLRGAPDAVPGLERLRWVTTDSLDAGLEDDWREPPLTEATLAFLQYTSGSTGTPKGVMVSHGNLLHNSSLLAEGFEYDESTRCVTWLPLYHDMGLIGGVLQPLHGGFHNTLISPRSFLRNPLGWLETISRKRATLSGGPNFAYELCARKATAEHLSRLDLGEWGVAFTGAEPIRPATLERFAETFAPCGFRRQAFFPCYGLAEATLIVSGGPKDAPPTARSFDRAALAQNRLREQADGDGEGQAVQGCGRVLDGHRVVVADPDVMTPCGPDEVGEIWVAGPSVAHGYWNRPDETERTFGARLAATGAGPFLRTGDLGFVRDGELFVTGRLKDLIIIRGRNYYPQDIELTVERSDAALRPGGGAAFSVEVGGEERLVVVQEVETRLRPDLDALTEVVRRAVSLEHELQTHAVVLVRPKSIPKTSSGKIQRRACRAQFLSGTLGVLQASVLAADLADESAEEKLSREQLLAAEPDARLELLETRFRQQVARVLGRRADELDPRQPLNTLGLDSLMAVELQNQIESELGVVLPMVGFLQSPGLRTLAARVLEQLNADEGARGIALAAAGPETTEHPLSPGQRGLWFLHQLAPESVAYNIARAAEIGGRLDVAALRRAFQSLVERHAALRTTFSAPGGEPVQRVREGAQVCFVEENAEGWDEAALRGRLAAECYRPFDLEEGPLLRVSVFRRAADEHVLLLVVHHIAVDFWSLAVLMEELGELYLAEANAREAALPTLRLRYTDYARWQSEMLRGPEGERLWGYWQKQLAGELPVIDLPLDRPRPAARTYRGASQFLKLDAGLTRRIKSLGRGRGATLYTTLLAAFQTLLHRYTGQDEIVVGSPVNGRGRAELAGLVGYFVNTVPVRARLAADAPFEVFLDEVREAVLGALEHQQYPFVQLVERLQPERNPSQSPLFQVMFVLQKSQFEKQELAALALGESSDAVRWGGLSWRTVALEQRVAQFDLTLMMAEVGDGLAASLEYNADLFEAATIRRMLGHFRVLLEAVTADPRRRISELPLLADAERRTMLVEWNATERADADADDCCAHELFERQAALTPSAVALAFGGESVSYGELDERANRLARHLRAHGVGPETLVGIYLERSVEMVVALLATLKAGGAYLPLDVSYPAERLSFMLGDAAVPVILTRRRHAGRLPAAAARVVALDAEADAIAAHPAQKLPPLNAPENLAYVIYTSGSTGRPKGVMIHHRGLVNYLRWCLRAYGLESGSGSLVHTPLGFDLTVTSLLAPLAAGQRVMLLAEEEGIEGLSRALREAQDLSLVKITPAHLEALDQLVPAREAAGRVREFVIGGEALLGKSLAFWREHAPGTRLINEYGPTETVVGCCTYEVPDGASLAGAVPIGRPIDNLKMYVLDGRLEPVPVGVRGELYIGGAGVGRGYLNRPALTAERFIASPFADQPGARLYRTGDLARYLPDGNIEYLGRGDDQVKVRGYRIELGEIEAVLAGQPAVGECVVVAREEEDGDKRLVAYLVAEDGAGVNGAELRSYLSERVPAYMVPSAFVVLEEMPLTPNGKVDRKALPAPEHAAIEPEAAEVGSRTPIEELLAGIWAEVLKVERVGVHDNFFELGGHSLLATRLVSRAREVFEVDVPLRSLFEAPTVAKWAEVVESLMNDGEGLEMPPIERVKDVWELPLSFAQQRLWFLDQLEPGNTSYNIPAAVRLKGPLNVAALERTLTEIVRRHEVLRTAFVMVDGPPRQLITPAQDVRLKAVDLSDLPPREREERARQLVASEAQTRFDLAAGPLLRARLLLLAEQEHILLLTMHHIISDGWSMGVLIREVAVLYQAFSTGEPSPLAELPIQYADFAVWQRQCLQGKTLGRQLDYWRRQLGGTLPRLELLTDHPRPPVQRFRGATETLSLSEELTAALAALSRREGASLFMTLLAGWQTLLARYTGQEEVVVGTPIANRNRAELEPLIGFFVNTLVLRTDLSGDPSFKELLGRVREMCLGAYTHQDVPFEKLVEELHPDRDLSHSPLFQTMFLLQNTPAFPLEMWGLEVSRVESETETAKFDLLLTMTETADGLTAALQYNTDLFEAATVRRMLAHLRTLLSAAAHDPALPLSALPLLSPDERRLLVHDWNQTDREFDRAACLHHLFERQAARTPAALALSFEDERLTYGELNERANRLAHRLRAAGVGPEVLVGVCLERSAELVVAILAALKAGGAYLPLDPSYPVERLRFMLADAAPRVLVTDSRLLAGLPPHGARTLCLDLEGESLAAAPAHDPLPLAAPANLAYVIYTSGSTGGPKGVQVEHRSVLNLLGALDEAVYAGQPSPSLVSLNAPASFDSSVKQLIQLARGRALCVVPERVRRDGEALLGYLAERRVDGLDCTPSQLRLLLGAGLGACAEAGAGVGVVLVGGEAIESGTWRQLEGLSGVAVYNVYGPTECTVDATVKRVGAGGAQGRPTIGRPVANTRAYILDARGEPAPVGVAGELYLGGAGLARGYLHRAGLTAERFVPDPFGGEPGGRLYRTGDLARFLADGEIEYLGRIDNQVKVRGYRIELGEIEAVLGEHARVCECVVEAREEAEGDKRLVAYVVAEAEASGEGAEAAVAVSGAELREYLRGRVPEYMVPSAFVMLDALPLTPNGKVDRKALPAPEQAAVEPEAAQAGILTPVEELLTGIWSEVLGVRQVGVNDNFFELGGHSLLATRLVSRAREVFEVEVPLRSLFEAPTPARLAEVVEAALLAEQAFEAPPMTPLPRTEHLPLSFAQQRLWFLDQLEPGSPFYNMPTATRLEGELNVAALERTLAEIVRRHEVLRTAFVMVEGQPVQVIQPPDTLRLVVEDLSALAPGEREAEASRRAEEEAKRPFDLSTGPLLRARLLRLAGEEHVLVLTMHHIVSDGWSMGVFAREVAALYAAYAAGEEPALAELPIQYADFATWQREWLEAGVLPKQLEYWKRQLEGMPPALELPIDHARPPVQGYRGEQQSFRLSEQLSKALKDLSRREGATPFMTLLAAFQTLLARYTGQEDIVVGTAIAGRNSAATENLIGFFANTLVLRTDLSDDPCAGALIRRVREMCLGAYAHQDVPFEKLVEELQPERDLSRSPLFQVMFLLHNTPARMAELPNLKLTPLGVDNGSAKLDLLVNMTEEASCFAGTWVYNTDLFEPATVRRMIEHFCVLLEGFVADPQRAVSALPLLGDGERREMLCEWNAAAGRASSRRCCVHELFEARAARTPDATAVVYEDERLTYAELNARANQLAHHLRTLGVGPETLVGVCVERGVEMIVALLGILKAGGAYVPLDPTYPPDRLAFMLRDASVRVLLTQKRLADSLPQSGVPVVCLDTDWNLVAAESTRNPDGRARPEHLAYVIYTSGSTGRPKGVMVCHRNVINLFDALHPRLACDEQDVWTVVHSYAFDFSVWEIFGPLLSGAKLVVVPYWVARTPAALNELLSNHRVTILSQTPSAFAQLVGEREQGGWDSEESSLRSLILGGEALPRELAQRLGPGRVAVWNFYGPTESTVWATVQPVDRQEGGVDIGRPLAGVEAFILDRRQQPVAVGVTGELHLGGANLARGYLNRPGLTAERFIPHPFSDVSGERLYKTGDSARFLADGRIEFLGRKDEQVKVRGYRIELGEIEAVLGQHDAVRECVVIVREDDPGDQRLVAYLVAEQEHAPAVSELRQYLKERVPEYMVPSAFVTLDALPLTPNGKADRRSLPAPEQAAAEPEAAEAVSRTPVEELLTGIWSEVLGVRQVGVNDNFFELGGHSLLATQVVSRVREIFQTELPLRSLFESPTVAGLAQSLETALRADQGQQAPPVLPTARDTYLPLSFAQQRLWFLDQLEPGSPFYNVSVALRLAGRLDVGALERSLREIVRRHETLRTTFKAMGGVGVQVIAPEGQAEETTLSVRDIPAGDWEEEVLRQAAAEARRPFDLASGPLLRTTLLRRDAEEHVFLLTLHHIVSDGWSLGVLVNEVAALYEAYAEGRPSPLAELPIQYADFAAWQRQWLQGDVFEAQLSYWKKRLADLPTLRLPTDRPRPAAQTFRGARQSLLLSHGLSEAVGELGRREGVTLYMTLLAAFQILLRHLTGQEDIVVGTDISNRNRGETEALIGFFANQLVLRTDLSGNPSVRELLGRVREAALDSYANQDLPFDTLVKALGSKREADRTPLFQVKLVLQNAPHSGPELPGLTMTPLEVDNLTAKFDLLLTVRQQGPGLSCLLEYSTDLFEPATITRFLKRFETALEAVVADPEARLDAVGRLLSEAERAETAARQKRFREAGRRKLRELSLK